MKTSHLAVLALALTGFSSEAMAWGADGHRAVAAIAIKLLPPDKAQAAENLLNNSDVDRGFVDAASYADEVIRERDHAGVFSPWHFVDWPADAAAYSDSFCKPDCIVNELPKQIEAMRTSTNTEAKALVMSWVIHLMGDLHQPMHVTDRGDRGGNEFKVTYNGRTRCRESNSTGTEAKVELHSVWDSCLVFTLESGRTFDKLADALRGNLTTYKGHPATSGTMMDWMKETHQAGIDTAYDGLSNGDDLAGVYIQHALPVVQQQLLNAGIRLAKIIDENF
jgi:nuclease S1